MEKESVTHMEAWNELDTEGDCREVETTGSLSLPASASSLACKSTMQRSHE